jgi:acyl-CoA reductase-like NAD-dependent aldehyde dehydrogenase
MVEAARSVRVGDPNAAGTQLGPLISAEQRGRVESYVASGVRDGGRLLVGGGRPDLGAPLDGGFFVEPTLFSGLDPDSAVVKDEIFGPVVAIQEFDGVDEAVRLANASEYGLAATVWTNDLKSAMELGDRLESGIIWTNCPHHLDWHVPYEGGKQSGLGEDLGSEAVQTFTRLKVHYLGYGGERIEW